MFEELQFVEHRKGGRYRIKKTPDGRRLEDNNEPFYEYESMGDGQVWIRCQSEMEDGRFLEVKST